MGQSFTFAYPPCCFLRWGVGEGGGPPVGYETDDASSNDVASFAGRAIGCWRTESQRWRTESQRWRTKSQRWRTNIFLFITRTVQGALSITLITSLYAKCMQVGLCIYIHTCTHKPLHNSCHAHTTVGEETGL